MSEYKRYKGKVKKVNPAPHETFLEMLQRISEDEVDNPNDFYNEDYVLVDKKHLFQITEKEELQVEESFMNLTKYDKDEFVFETQYYNGGTCLYEMLSEALKPR